MVDEIENVESVNLVLSPSELSNLAIPDEMIPDDVKDIFESDRYKMIFVNSTEEIATNKLHNDPIIFNLEIIPTPNVAAKNDIPETKIEPAELLIALSIA